MALFHTAISDAAIAAWDAQVAHDRPSPAATSDEITPAAGVDPAQSSFPSEHAAVAGAAATVLAYLVPDAEAGRFDTLATEAAESRIAAGAAFRSDVDAGLALGQAVGEKAVARGKGDGADAEWDLERPAHRPRLLGADAAGIRRDPVFPLAGASRPGSCRAATRSVRVRRPIRIAGVEGASSTPWRASPTAPSSRSGRPISGTPKPARRSSSRAGCPRPDPARRARPAARRADPGRCARRHRRRRDRGLGRQVHLVDVAPDH